MRGPQYSTVQQHDCSINDKSVQGSSTHIVISPLHGSVSGIAHGSATPIKCTHAHGSTNTRDHTSVHGCHSSSTLYETTTDSLSDHSDHTTSTHHTTPQSTHLKSVYGYESAASKPYGNISRGPPLLCSDSNRNSLSQCALTR
jgi:hypothetical protein